MFYCVSDTCLFSMWTYCALMPLAQTIEIMLYRRGMLVREDLKKEKKKKLQTGWDFENLDFEILLTNV